MASALLLAFLLRLDWLFGLYLASPLDRAMLSGSPRVAMLAGVAGLVSGLLLRPVGGVLLGWRSDRVDRAGTLRLLAWIMAGGSVLIGAVPGYGTVGMLAPAAALLGRAAQGVATGGALACTLSLLVEAAPGGRRYAFAGLLAAATLLASAVAGWIAIELSLSLSEAALAAWGWRLPFLAGLLLGPLAAWLLRPLDAPPAADRPARLPPALAAGVGLLLAGAALTYFWRGYVPLWVTARLHLPLAAALLGSGVSLLVAVMAVGIGGLLAEMFDARAVFALAAAASALAVWPLFAWLAAVPTVQHLFQAQLVASLLLALAAGAAPGLLASLFPPAWRARGIAVADAAVACYVAGALPPGLAALRRASGFDTAPALAVAALVALALALLRLGRRRPG